MSEITTVGLDLAKNVFQVHGADAAGRAELRKKLRRDQVLAFFRHLPPCVVAMEACVGAHFWGREIGKLGHEVRLIPPAYVKPFVKRQQADLVIWCGSKVSQNTGMNWTLPTPEQATITIDIDPLEHGRTFHPTIPLFGDVRDTVRALHAALGKGTAGTRPDWMARIAKVKAACAAEAAEEMASAQVPVLPPRVAAEIGRRLGAEDVIVSDASFAAGWIAGDIPARRPGRQFLFARGQGGLGYSVRGAIGAATQLAPGARVVTLADDGAFSCTIGELATQAQYNQRIVNVVINNGKLGWINLWQEIFFKNPISSSLETHGSVPAYAAAGMAMGLKGFYVEKPDEIGAALDAAFAHEGPSVVEIRIDDRAPPLHGFKRRMRETEDKPRPRPGTVYKLRA